MKLPTMYNDLGPTDRRLVREYYSNLQKGKCWYCGCGLDGPPPKRVTDKPINLKLFPEKFLDYPHHLQHDHETGLTEGTVHAYCNAVLWQYYRR